MQAKKRGGAAGPSIHARSAVCSITFLQARPVQPAKASAPQVPRPPFTASQMASISSPRKESNQRGTSWPLTPDLEELGQPVQANPDQTTPTTSTTCRRIRTSTLFHHTRETLEAGEAVVQSNIAHPQGNKAAVHRKPQTIYTNCVPALHSHPCSWSGTMYRARIETCA